MKKLALKDSCKCKECTYRFSCFTSERIFSDPILQGLFEALIARGMSKEDALESVTTEIKSRIDQPRPDPQTIPDNPYTLPYIDPAPNTWQPYTIWTNDTFDVKDGTAGGNTITNTNINYVNISYIMMTGEVVNWSVGDANNEL